MHHKILSSLIGATTLAFSASVVAKVSADEAAKLGTSLTPVGAEKGANSKGTIGEWTNGAMFDATQKQLTPEKLEEIREQFEKLRASNPAPFDKLMANGCC